MGRVPVIDHPVGAIRQAAARDPPLEHRLCSFSVTETPQWFQRTQCSCHDPAQLPMLCTMGPTLKRIHCLRSVPACMSTS